MLLQQDEICVDSTPTWHKYKRFPQLQRLPVKHQQGLICAQTLKSRIHTLVLTITSVVMATRRA
jgi:hypothetical protein